VGQGKPVMIDLRDAQHILNSQLVTTDGNGNFSTKFVYSAQLLAPTSVPFFVTANYTGDTSVAGTSTTLDIAPVKVYLPLILR
jgi:hypothetical protein